MAILKKINVISLKIKLPNATIKDVQRLIWSKQQRIVRDTWLKLLSTRNCPNVKFLLNFSAKIEFQSSFLLLAMKLTLPLSIPLDDKNHTLNLKKIIGDLIICLGFPTSKCKKRHLYRIILLSVCQEYFSRFFYILSSVQVLTM